MKCNVKQIKNFSKRLGQPNFKRYCLWDRYETKIGMMPVPKIVLTSLIDKATTIAKDNGIQNIEHYRDVIIKQA